jgi:peptidoglycan-associated lipoprotein
MNHSKKMDAARFIAASVVAVTAAACSSNQTQARSADSSAQVSASASLSAESTGDKRNDRDTTVTLSEDLRTGCSIPTTTDDAPHFDYNEAKLHARGANVLNDVAKCLTEGPLKGRTVYVVGRTDPRGTESHNEQLGASRAGAARDYLVGEGVAANSVSVTSRGEQGAAGDDEATWALDRRVDLQLTPPAGPANASSTAPTKAADIVDATRQTVKPGDKKGKGATYSDAVEGGAEGPVKSKAAPLPSTPSTR